MLRETHILLWQHPDTQPMLDRLAGLGCSVVCSSSIEEAIALHHAQPFTMLLASPGLEGESDFAVLKLLRRALPTIPLVLLSAEASVAVRIR